MENIVQTVLIVLVILVVLYFVLTWMFQSSTQLTSMADGTEKQVIKASDLPSNNQTSNYTYSMWFYVYPWSP